MTLAPERRPAARDRPVRRRCDRRGAALPRHRLRGRSRERAPRVAGPAGRRPWAAPGREAPRRRSTAASRAFTRSGAQVVFVLLSWPRVTVRPLREIARASGVSLGTAQIVVEELTSAGYLYDGPHGRTLARGGELLSRWAEAYMLWLSPRLHLAAFAVDDPRWWDGADVELDDAGAQLGGELAASLLGPDLEPTTTTLYADEVPEAVIARHRMTRDEQHGTVLVRRRFWHLPDDASALVPAPLVYADLMASGAPRQREQADLLRRHHDRLTRLDRS